MTLPLVSISWIDSVLLDRYCEEENGAPQLGTLESVGFLVKETDELVLIARETQHNGLFRGCVVIPKFAIKSRKVLRQR